MQELQSEPVQVFDLHHTHPQSEEIDRMKQALASQHGGEFVTQCIFQHSNVNLLYTYLFFALADQQLLSAGPASILDKAASSDVIALCSKKFYIDWDPRRSLASALWQRHNNIIFNKLLVQEVSNNLTEEECQALLVLLPVDVGVIVTRRGVSRQFRAGCGGDWVHVGQLGNGYVMAVFSQKNETILNQKQAQKGQKQQIKQKQETKPAKALPVALKHTQNLDLQEDQTQKHPPAETFCEGILIVGIFLVIAMYLVQSFRHSYTPGSPLLAVLRKMSPH